MTNVFQFIFSYSLVQGCDYYAVKPPSIGNITPVIQSASFEARKMRHRQCPLVCQSGQADVTA